MFFFNRFFSFQKYRDICVRIVRVASIVRCTRPDLTLSCRQSRKRKFTRSPTRKEKKFKAPSRGSALEFVGQTEILWHKMNVLPHDVALKFIVGGNTDRPGLFTDSFEPHMVLRKQDLLATQTKPAINFT